MSNISNYVAGKIIDHIVGKTSFTIPANIYIGLKTANPTNDNSGGVEPTIGTGSYARKQCVAADFNAAGLDRQGENANNLDFAKSTAAWSTGATNLTHFIFMDAAAGGNMLGYGQLTNPRAVDAANIILEFAVDTLVITAS
jgi:hypothetical protein